MVALAEVNVAQKSSARLLIIGRKAFGVVICHDLVSYTGEKLRLDKTVIKGHYTVASCGEKAIAAAIGSVANGKLSLIAITKSVGSAYYRFGEHFKIADAGKSVTDKAFLGFKLGGISDMAQGAAAALVIYRAIWLDSGAAMGKKLFYLAVAVGLVDLDYTAVDDIANSGIRYKNCHTLISADAIALACESRYFQTDYIILFH